MSQTSVCIVLPFRYIPLYLVRYPPRAESERHNEPDIKGVAVQKRISQATDFRYMTITHDDPFLGADEIFLKIGIQITCG